jgi:integrase
MPGKKPQTVPLARNLDQARIREIVMETVERVTGKRTDSPTVSQWLERWIRTEKGAVAGRTMMRYEQIVRDFLGTIGAQAPLETLLTDTILEFKERWLSGGRFPRTVNHTIKILKRPFKIALEEGLIDRNPVAAVRSVRTSSAKKGVFSQEQIQKSLEVAEGDWRGLILSGYFTGGRLVDLARLTWGEIDLSDRINKSSLYRERPDHPFKRSNSDSSGFVRISIAIGWIRSSDNTGLPQTFQ